MNLKLYASLFSVLDTKEFRVQVQDDWNRLGDGEYLKYRFAYEKGIPYAEVDSGDMSEWKPKCIDVILAIAYSIRNMALREESDSISDLFWGMMNSMGLDNPNLSVKDIIQRLDDFMDRNFEPNGHGGLFIVNNPNLDMRELTIWEQINVYVGEKYTKDLSFD